MGIYIGAAAMENSMEVKKLKIELPYDPAIPLVGIYPGKILILKDTCTPLFRVSLFAVAKE